MLFVCVRYLHRLPSECPEMTLREFVNLAAYAEWELETKAKALPSVEDLEY